MPSIQTLSEHQLDILREIYALHTMDRYTIKKEEELDIFDFIVNILHDFNAEELQEHIVRKEGKDEFEAMLGASVDCAG